MDTKDFLANDGLLYQIRIDDNGEDIEVYLNGVKQGRICVQLFEIENSTDNNYYITDLSLEPCKGQGVGRACLKLHQEIYNSRLHAADPSGQEQENGGHLIDDGVGFIAKMRKEGIVLPFIANND